MQTLTQEKKQVHLDLNLKVQFLQNLTQEWKQASLKRNMPNRNYREEYRKFQSSSKSKLDRASRNRARRKLMASGAVSKGDGKDIDHRDKNPRNNSRSNLRITSKKLNRGKYRVA